MPLEILYDLLGNTVKMLKPTTFNAIRDTEFWLFVRTHPSQPHRIVLNDPTTLQNSRFNAQHPTRLLIHGWNQNSSNSDLTTLGLRAYMSRSESLNIIVVNWGPCAQDINYMAVVDCVPHVGDVIAQLVDWLHLTVGLAFALTTAIGSSLGAHVAGMAGKCVTHGRLAAIIALDPAKPGFQYSDPTTRLSSTDADYVESVQTNADGFGFGDAIGQVAFYMNGGRNQPRCGLDLIGACSHHSAVVYFIESISNSDAFWGVRCGADYSAIKSRKCPPSGNDGDGLSSVAVMGGEPIVPDADGVYYVKTNKKVPYGQGPF